MNDETLFAQVLELGRLLGWHDGSAQSRHQEYVAASRWRRRRADSLSDDRALIAHADALNKALIKAALVGGELANLVLDQQRDDVARIHRPRNVIGLDEPAAIMALNRAGVQA